MAFDVLSVAARFCTDGNVISASPFGEGHINGTYLVRTDAGKKYTLQSINTAVFKDPCAVMNNISLVLAHLKKKITEACGDPDRECLTVVKTDDGKDLLLAADGAYYRMYGFIEGNVYQTVEKPEHFYCAAKAFGNFQKQLSDFPAELLVETIPHFHDTPRRLENLEKAIREDKCGRVQEVQDEIAFARAHRDACRLVVDAIAAGEIPLRVTHNDTKFNNVLLDDEGRGFCVIDLDTVMPGSMLYDFGDAIRSGATYAAEDEHDLARVTVDFELFEAYTKGYLEALGDSIKPKELELLAFSGVLLTLECGMRFLTDYLEGDVYFKTHYDKQNLYRTRSQFALAADMEKKLDALNAIVKKYAK